MTKKIFLICMFPMALLFGIINGFYHAVDETVDMWKHPDDWHIL